MHTRVAGFAKSKPPSPAVNNHIAPGGEIGGGTI